MDIDSTDVAVMALCAVYAGAVSSEGNAITGSACSTCGGVIDITSRQVNSNTITAGSTTTIGGSGRSATSTSTAVGNSATFYSSRPNG